MAKTIADLQALAVDDHVIDSNKKEKEIRERLAALGTAGQEAVAPRDDIFSLLTTFFSHYSKDGGFLSLLRYQADTYAIPYESIEVKLHWANADQFYIKSAKNFRDYTFRPGPPPGRPLPRLNRPTWGMGPLHGHRRNQRRLTAEQVWEDILRIVFNEAAGGILHVRNLKSAAGELSLTIGNSAEP